MTAVDSDVAHFERKLDQWLSTLKQNVLVRLEKLSIGCGRSLSKTVFFFHQGEFAQAKMRHLENERRLALKMKAK